MSTNSQLEPLRFPFRDHHDADCTLLVCPGQPLFSALFVEHPRCDHPADVSADLDAFYCTQCRWNGRISGAWAVDMWQEAQ